jgi:hypothetical protein
MAESDTEESWELHQPLEILRSTTRRLMDRQIPATSTRLEEMYAHLRGSIGDILDGVGRQVSQALQLARENATDESSQTAETVEAAQQMIGEAQEEIADALAQVKESFFAASTFSELQERMPNLGLFESRLEGAMLRVEEALMMSGDPELFPAGAFVPAPTVPEALEALAEGLDQIQLHLQGGDKEPLRRALEAVNRAQLGLTAALAD